jgi:anti-anti-sigma factor
MVARTAARVKCSLAVLTEECIRRQGLVHSGRCVGISTSRGEDIVTIAHGPTSDHLSDDCNRRRVEDFYCSHGIPFFAAVVSTCPQHDPHSRVTRATLAGDLDCATAPILRSCIARMEGNVDVDCSGLDFVGVSGVEVLLDARARWERAGASFEIVAPSPTLRRVLLLAGVSC